jgi:hypothetical protein
MCTEQHELGGEKGKRNKLAELYLMAFYRLQIAFKGILGHICTAGI